MTVKQISVFLENKFGKLADCCKVLREGQVNMRALSIAETTDFGILRIIVDDSYKASSVLKDAGYVFSITPVLAAAVNDEPGSLYRILEILSENKINLEYTYAFTARAKDLAYMILRVEDADKAAEALGKNGVKLVSQEELSNL